MSQEEKKVWNREEALLRLADDGDLLKEVCVEFLKNLPSGLDKLRCALERGDLAETAKEAHSWKGACASVGAESCQETALRIEKSALQGDAAASASWYASFEAELGVLRKTFARELGI